MTDSDESRALIEARSLLSEVTRYLGSMPDAGLTNNDPRQGWYVASKPLRDRALAFLSGHEIGCLRGQTGYYPYLPIMSCCRGYGYVHEQPEAGHSDRLETHE
jgi:hypothetical protein